MTTRVDPERFSTKEACREADTDTLYAAFEEAKRVYFYCGGHKLAARMFNVMETVKREINDRDLPMPGVE